MAGAIWLFAFVSIELGDSFLGLGAIFLWLALGAYTVGLVAVSLFKAVTLKQLSVIYPAIAIVFVIALFRGTPLGLASVYLRLFAEQDQYQQAIEATAAGDNQLCEKLRCIVEDIEEKQVAFAWDGIIDNWYGICHDPTATVLKANILKRDWSNRNDPEYGKAAGMFDGTMTGAEHLWGKWYLCSFT